MYNNKYLDINDIMGKFIFRYTRFAIGLLVGFAIVIGKVLWNIGQTFYLVHRQMKEEEEFRRQKQAG